MKTKTPSEHNCRLSQRESVQVLRTERYRHQGLPPVRCRGIKARAWTASIAVALLLPVSTKADFLPVGFAAGTGAETGIPGGTVTVPITVENFSDLYGAQFTLTWDSSKLTSATVVGVNPALSSGTTQTDVSTPGQLGFLWFGGGTGATITGGAAVFSVQFSMSPGLSGGATIPLLFGDGPIAREVTFSDFSAGDPGNGLMITTDGLVTAVPEPVNYALVLFATSFLGAGGWRWLSSRKA